MYGPLPGLNSPLTSPPIIQVYVPTIFENYIAIESVSLDVFQCNSQPKAEPLEAGHTVALLFRNRFIFDHGIQAQAKTLSMREVELAGKGEKGGEECGVRCTTGERGKEAPLHHHHSYSLLFTHNDRIVSPPPPDLCDVFDSRHERDDGGRGDTTWGLLEQLR
ncbi:hypothetical protein D9615_010707 [Tricholomella constricta]|uniref:Uncharacterized protein n=1 Tax=Tricholomella constricta TaxID=117010 RepID=A0A8H5LQU2_9AGAR|nr:hypothetical protein D9615_010707 [Tricholomella constricta]